ncbi:15.4 kDa class V heat shock protein [Tripterygium wilfordii]|uniref:15.4 kDa class V heat shock protein n=1 Tax=Tripterygium wilfordii TaxID=458696 RepID=A0A7J7C5D5_TRIWF|nr:15.4 kDa class V heat shock protein [Tripterygium wilfordii]KAF5729037.1 15.4 kDa class V heat shock protein [Tripterygium wilfordii]
MDFQYQPFPLPYILTSPHLFSSPIIPENYVHYTQTPESHIYSADLPGVRKEEIKVEVEDSRYLIIRTEAIDESSQPAKSFLRKFRLPGRIDINGISAGYEDGVLTVTVPIISLRKGFYIDPADIPESLEVIARAA